MKNEDPQTEDAAQPKSEIIILHIFNNLLYKETQDV